MVSYCRKLKQSSSSTFFFLNFNNMGIMEFSVQNPEQEQWQKKIANMLMAVRYFIGHQSKSWQIKLDFCLWEAVCLNVLIQSQYLVKQKKEELYRRPKIKSISFISFTIRCTLQVEWESFPHYCQIKSENICYRRWLNVSFLLWV